MPPQTFRVSDIQPNPFRHLSRYPIKQEKVDALRESLRTTGFWENVVARLGDKGQPELAYGHHRHIALAEEFGADAEVSLNIRKLDDETMLKIMVRENMEEWDTSAEVVIETIRAVVEAHAAGQITLNRPEKNVPSDVVIYAPSFTPGTPSNATRSSDKPYTIQSLALFLGWILPSGVPADRARYGINVLQSIEQGNLTEDAVSGLTVTEIKATITEGRRALKRRKASAKIADKEAAIAEKEGNLEGAAKHKKRAADIRNSGKKAEKKIVRKVSAGMKAGSITAKNAAQKALEIDNFKPAKELPDINIFVRKIGKAIRKTLTDDVIENQFGQLIEFREFLDDEEAYGLQREFELLAERALNHAQQLKPRKEIEVNAPEEQFSISSGNGSHRPA